MSEGETTPSPAAPSPAAPSPAAPSQAGASQDEVNAGAASETPVQDLLDATAATRTGPGPDGTERFAATAPDWFGDRVFGGVVVAQALSAAAQTVDPPMRPHSLHGYFLGALRAGPVDLSVRALRDGRTFSTRHVTSEQHGRTALWCTVSFHADEDGDEYQLPMPAAPEPVADPVDDDDDWQPPMFDFVELGPSPPRADGTYRSTRRAWVRTIEALPDDPLCHLQVAAYLSDMTGASFRPHSLGEWGRHTDASIDHAVWFHHPFRADEWLYMDFHALVNHHGRATIRGELFDRSGRLCLSMAQELLIRELEEPSS